MANSEHVEVLNRGVDAWNLWRKDNPEIQPDLQGLYLNGTENKNLNRTDLVRRNGVNLRGVNLRNARLTGATLQLVDLRDADLENANLSYTRLPDGDFRGANLVRADLSWSSLHGGTFQKTTLRGAIFWGADLGEADLSGADLYQANLSWTDLVNAKLNGATLQHANLAGSNLRRTSITGADLTSAILESTHMIETNFENAIIQGCWVYGISAWRLKLKGALQTDLLITGEGEPRITVDDLEVAQFIHLLLSREKLRNIIQTVTSKAVLILGRFTPERKEVLDGIAHAVREHSLIPIIFDFERATTRDFTETIKTLAGMSFFVIVDITNPKSAPLELAETVPDYQIPFIPIIQQGEQPFSMFANLSKYGWVSKLLIYPSASDLIKAFKPAVIDEAFRMHKAILKLKAEELETRNVEDYLKNQG